MALCITMAFLTAIWLGVNIGGWVLPPEKFEFSVFEFAALVSFMCGWIFLAVARS